MSTWDERGLRVVLLDNARRPLRELPPGRLTACKVTDELGGESSLTLSWVLGTSVPDVRAESRVLLRDGRGRWREYVAKGGARVRTSGQVREATLRAEASWQSDVRLSEPMPEGSAWEGAPASEAYHAIMALTGWEGSCSVGARVGWLDVSGKGRLAALRALAEAAGGELEPSLSVGPDLSVTAQSVSLVARLAASVPAGRLDWGLGATDATVERSEGDVVTRATFRSSVSWDDWPDDTDAHHKKTVRPELTREDAASTARHGHLGMANWDASDHDVDCVDLYNRWTKEMDDAWAKAQEKADAHRAAWDNLDKSGMTQEQKDAAKARHDALAEAALEAGRLAFHAASDSLAAAIVARLASEGDRWLARQAAMRPTYRYRLAPHVACELGQAFVVRDDEVGVDVDQRVVSVESDELDESGRVATLGEPAATLASALARQRDRQRGFDRALRDERARGAERDRDARNQGKSQGQGHDDVTHTLDGVRITKGTIAFTTEKKQP